MSQKVTEIFLKISQDAETESYEVLASFKEGETGILSRFQFSSYSEFARLLLEKGFQALDTAMQNPPNVILPSVTEKPQSKPTGKATVPVKAAAKPKILIGPYVLLTAKGKRRGLTMIDGFEIQERCMKNKALEFSELEAAKEIARAIAAQDESEITIAAGKQAVPYLKISADGSILDLVAPEEATAVSCEMDGNEVPEDELESVQELEEKAEDDFSALIAEEDEAEEDFSALIAED